MCGRFQLSVKGKEISERFNVEVHNEIHRPSGVSPSPAKGFNCAPFQWLPVILNTKPECLSYLRWGLVPSWAANEREGAKLINVRAETMHQKPAFRRVFEQGRCLVPANGFYEWDNKSPKQAYRFFLQNEKIFAFAGIWDQWKNADGQWLSTFSIVTTSANTLIEPIHRRMPVILNREAEKIWLDHGDKTPLTTLLKAFPSAEMDYYPVSALVNKVSNDDERLIAKQERIKGLFD